MTPTADIAQAPTVTDRSKMVVTMLVLASATGLLTIGRISGAEWVSAITWTVSAFMLGQVGAVIATGWSMQTVAKATLALETSRGSKANV
jgi:hypothetical protein